jgi:chemotaxis family two-component system response regulator Rcp1
MVEIIMSIENNICPIEVLIVEDSDADIRLVKEAFKDGKMMVNLIAIKDGFEAMVYLRKENEYTNVSTPDLVLLDLNMPIKNGFEVLDEIKQDQELRRVPIIIMTISKTEEDILKSYNLHANAYIVKPVELNQFMSAIRSIENFWLTVVKLPPKAA